MLSVTINCYMLIAKLRVELIIVKTRGIQTVKLTDRFIAFKYSLFFVLWRLYNIF